MGVEGVDYVYLETHNYGQAGQFWQNLGFELELDLGVSGQWKGPDGTRLFIEEVPEDAALANHLFLRVSDTSFLPGPPAEVVGGYEPSHWGSQLLQLRDPDGRPVVLQVWDPGSQR